MAKTTFETAPSLTVSTQSSMTWTLKNSCGKDIIAIDAYADTVLPDNDLYGLTLKPLFFEQTGVTLPQSVIATGKSATVTFGNPHLDKDSQEPLDYTIIIARADTLFPVKIVEISLAVTAGESPLEKAPDLEVTAEDLVKMEKAQLFKKYISALPDSKLALDYATAVQTNDPAKATAFFAGTTDFKTLNQEAVVAVNSYYEVYPYAWTDYTASKTYYLYDIDRFKGKPLGDLTIAYTGGIPMNTDQTLADFTVTYTPTDAADGTPLAYSLEQFVAGPADAPTTHLLGTFRVKGELTNDTSANGIISCIIGAVNGKHVFGIDEKAPVPEDPLAPDDPEDDTNKEWGFYEMLHNQNVKDYGDALIYGTGILIGLFFLGKLGIRITKFFARKATNGRIGKTDEQKLDEKLQDLKRQTDAVLERVNQLRPEAGAALPAEGRLPRNAPAPAEALNNLRQLRTNRVAIANRGAIEVLNQNMEAQTTYCERVGALNARAVQNVADSLSKIQNDLQRLSNRELLENFDEYLDTFKFNRTMLETAKNHYGRAVEGQIAQDLATSLDVTQLRINEAEANKAAREEAVREQEEARVREEALREAARDGEL